MSAASAFLPLLLEILLKGVLLMGLTVLLSIAIQGAAASVRHAFWMIAVVGLLALPVVALAGPSWRVSVPESWVPFVVFDREVDEASRHDDGPASEGGLGTNLGPNGAAAGSGIRLRSMNRRDLAALKATSPGGATPPLESPSISREADPHGPAALRIPWGVILTVAWGIGAAFLLLRLLVGLNAVRRLQQSSRVVSHGREPEMARALGARLGLAVPTRLLRAPPDSMPVSCGILRPAVLLPDTREWADRRLTAVLLHELAHVRRKDCLTQVVAEVAVALHWPNPLAWLAARRLLVEREHACDDEVLRAGASPSEYARELIDMVASLRPFSVGGTVAMARPPHLAARVRAILDDTRTRDARGGSRRLGSAAGVAVVLCLAALTPEAPSSADASRATPRNPSSRFSTQAPPSASGGVDRMSMGVGDESLHANTPIATAGVSFVSAIAAYPLATLTDVFTLEPWVLEEDAKVATTGPSFFPDPDGGIFAADDQAQQFRKYDAEGGLEWSFGRYGDGPDEFRTISTITRISDRRVAAADHNKLVVWDVPTNRAVKAISYVPVPVITGPLHYLGEDRILLQSLIDTPGDRGLHVLDVRTGTIERSFFAPRTEGLTFWDGTLPLGTGRVNSSMRGDTIASTFAYSDTVYLHTTDGALVEKIPFSTQHFERARTSPSEHSAYRDWMKTVSQSLRLFWLNDGSFLIEYSRPLPPEELIPGTAQPYPRALMRMSRGGALIFDVLDSPPIATVDVTGNVFFRDEESRLPNHLIRATLKSPSVLADLEQR